MRSDDASLNAPLAPGVQQLIAAGGLVLGLTALVLGVQLDSSPVGVIRAAAEASTIAVPIGVGLYALNRDRSNRFALLLVIAGFAWAPTMLSFTTASVPYSVGRTWAWMQEGLLIYLLLALPIGRLVTFSERLVGTATFVIVTALYLPTVFFAQFPNPSAFTDCSKGCTDNAFILTSSTPSLINAMIDVRGFLTVGVFLAAALVVGLRVARDTRLVRIYGAALGLAIVHLVGSAVFFTVRGADPGGKFTEIAGLVALVSEPLMILAFFAGLFYWRRAARSAWGRLTPDVSSAETSQRMRALVADALGDPSVELGYWDPSEQHWIDDTGWPFALPPRRSGRAHTEISAQGRPVAVFVHQEDRLAASTIRDLVRGVALLALENLRLEASMRASTRALRESRARIMAAVDKDRLRIERDLHDGAQQRLIALKVAADLGADALREDPGKAAELFERIGADAGLALEEVRSLARGVYPPLLIDFGLVAALNDACSRSIVPAVVRARGVGRYPPEVEAAVYFCCLEALQNSEKHSEARSITITLVADGNLSFEVRDNGCGFEPGDDFGGAGLGNMRDRIAAVDGKLRVDSVADGGTRVSGTVPLAPDHLPPEVERLLLTATEALHGALGIYKAVRTPSGTVVDFAVEHVNEAACQLSGMSRQAQVGRTLSQLDPSYARSEAFRWHCTALEAGGETLVREESEHAWTTTGRRLQVAYEVRAVALGAGRIALLWHDITERKRTERDLAFRADATAYEADGVCVVRASTGAIAYANAPFERMLGYQSGELEGRDSSDLDWQDERGDAVYGDASEEQTRVLRARRKDGSFVWCELTLSGFDDPDLGWCWVTVNRDVTARREEMELATRRHERLGEALRGLPLLAYTADTDLNCTLLFDNLIDPVGSDGPRSGRNEDLFGPLLAERIANVNRRALVTGMSAREVVDFGRRGTVTVSVEPVTTADGDLVGLVGTALGHEGEGPVQPAIKGEADGHSHRVRAPRVFSRLR